MKQATATAPPRSPSDRVAEIFNSTVAAFAVAAAWELGALDELSDQGSVDCEAFCGQHDLDPASTRSMFTALAAADVVRRAGPVVHPGPNFLEVYRHKAFFHWLTVGCADLFASMARVTRNRNRLGPFYRRDAAAIGFACRDINLMSFDPVFWRAMESLDFDVTVVADLGCGTGGRLVQLVERYPAARGVGIDIAPSVVRDAQEYVRTADLAGRIEFVEADVRTLQPDAMFDEVELLTCFMMGHDFWPRDECVAVLRRLRLAFPRVRRFLLGDTARTQGIPERGMPVFTLAFETAHDLMGVYLPTLQEWTDVFTESDWKCQNVHRVDVPVDSFIFDLV
jgi:SAM-dependent methyltransferase